MDSSKNSSSARIYSSCCRRHHHRMQSPSCSGYYYSLPPISSSPSAFASSTTSSFSTRSLPAFRPQHHHYLHNHRRATSPTRVNFIGSTPQTRTPSVSFSIDRRTISTQNQSLSAKTRHIHPHNHQQHQQQRRTCMCSPTKHPGSFRCSLHKSAGYQISGHRVSAPSNRLNARRSAMTNSLIRIGTVEGELVKRALAALIRPSSHQQRRRAAFQPRPSRLSTMSKVSDSDDDLF